MRACASPSARAAAPSARAASSRCSAEGPGATEARRDTLRRVRGGPVCWRARGRRLVAVFASVRSGLPRTGSLNETTVDPRGMLRSRAGVATIRSEARPMTEAVAQILTQLDHLTQQERAELAYAFLLSLEPQEAG